MNDHGFITLHRRVFKHHLFRNERPFSRLHAWAWMIAAAAWCPCQRRVGRALVTLDRGQFAATTRDLGKTWGWHRSRVERFLRLLRKDAMIRTRAGETVAETQGETPRRAVVSIITICNYSAFQNISTGKDSEPRQSPRQKPRRGEQQALDLGDEILPQPFNKSTKKAKEVAEEEKRKEIRGRMGRTKPRHGQTSKKNGTIWIDNGTDDWKVYAADYERVTGTSPLPQQYIGGSGRWFSIFGEGARPPPLRTESRAQLDSKILAGKRRRTA